MTDAPTKNHKSVWLVDHSKRRQKTAADTTPIANAPGNDAVLSRNRAVLPNIVPNVDSQAAHPAGGVGISPGNRSGQIDSSARDTSLDLATKSLSAHPLADLFPMPSEADLNLLAKDIQENGLRNAITLHNGIILDGRSRYRACRIAGVVPNVTEYSGDDPLAFVISQNLYRRHLTESQRAMAAARLANLQPGANQFGSEGLPIGSAAKLMNVSARSVARAKEVLRRGNAELIADVTSGKVTVSAATNRLRRNVPSEKVLNAGVEQNGNAGLAIPPKSEVPWAPVADSSETLILPAALDRRDPERLFASLKAAWDNASLAVRERFIREVLPRRRPRPRRVRR